MNKLMRVATVLLAMPAIGLAIAGTAHADTLYIDDVQYGVKKPVAISECRADGSTCRIDSGRTVASTITGDVGVDFGALNASLGGSYQETYTVTTSCTSPTLAPGDVYVMFPRGDFVFFNVDGAKGTAFLPTGVFCEVRSDW